ncbi:MAG: EI24 domain-containing protein, partial [Novosphingobium sp.]
AATLIACALLGALGWWGLSAAIERYAGDSEIGNIVAGLAVLLALWLLWRVVALAVLQFFADEVVSAVEARDYPAMAMQARKLGLREEIMRGIGGALRALVFNLAALPVALLLLFTGVGAPLVFIAVNAVLLGRELQDMVWLRHRPSPDSPAPLSSFERFALGGITALLLTVPFANFVAPSLGAACAVHLIHRKGRFDAS